MTSVPLIDQLFRGKYGLGAGSSVNFKTPYGEAGIQFGTTPLPTPPPFIGGMPNLGLPASSNDVPVPEQDTPAGPAPVNADPAPLQPTAQNATQRWQQGSTGRYYDRKYARDMQASARTPAEADMYRRDRRIVPGDAHIAGYGTPAAPPEGLTGTGNARPPVGLGTERAQGYGGSKRIYFENSASNWTPYG